MPYCTRCGKPIAEGERCSCQKTGIHFDISSGHAFAEQFFGLQEKVRDPKECYERGMKIIPDNVRPDDGEKPIRQYDLCTLRSRIKFMRAEGRLQVTNKRIIFRAKGTSLTGPTILQQEFSISELSGFQINKNTRFSPLDLLLSVLLSIFLFWCGQGIARAMVDNSAGAFLGFVSYVLGLAGCVLTFLLGKHHLSRLSLAALVLPLMLVPAAALIRAQGIAAAFGSLLTIPAIFCFAQLVVSNFLFSFKPNLDFAVCSKMGSGVIHLRCEPGGFAGLGAMINAAYVGYNEVLPAKDTDRAINEIGALLSDIQKLGDFAIEKWKED